MKYYASSVGIRGTLISWDPDKKSTSKTFQPLIKSEYWESQRKKKYRQQVLRDFFEESVQEWFYELQTKTTPLLFSTSSIFQPNKVFQSNKVFFNLTRYFSI